MLIFALIFVTFDRYQLYSWYKLTFDKVYVHEKCNISYFKFPKVMQQRTSGVVGNLMWILLEIYCSLQQWKNFVNRSRIDKVIAMVRVEPFFDSRCRLCTLTKQDKVGIFAVYKTNIVLRSHLQQLNVDVSFLISIIKKTKLASVSLCCKSHRFKTTDVKILSASSKRLWQTGVVRVIRPLTWQGRRTS